MKIKITIFLLFFAVVSVYSRDSTHFRIYADLQRYPFFIEVLRETVLDDVFPDKFQMVINTDRKIGAFIVIGCYDSPDVEWDREAYRYDWMFLSKRIREKILAFKQKILLE